MVNLQEKPFHEEKPFEVLLWKNFNMEAFKRNTRTNPIHKSYSKNLKASLDFCMQNPRWSLSLQTHKILGIK